MNLEINEYIDAFVPECDIEECEYGYGYVHLPQCIWVVAQIKNKTSAKIHVKWYGFDYMNIILKTSHYIDTLNTHTIPFQIINHNINNIHLYLPIRKLLFYNGPKEEKYLIAITATFSIMKYNIINNQWTHIKAIIPTKLHHQTTAQLIITINSNTNKLYIINHFIGILEFDLIKHSWKVLLNKTPVIGAHNACNIWIGNKLRIIDCHSINKVLDIDITTNKCNIYDAEGLSGVLYPFKSKNNSYLFLKVYENIAYIGSFDGVFGDKIKWNIKKKIKVPQKMFIEKYSNIKYVIPIFYHFLLVVTYGDFAVWFYDINVNKWFECNDTHNSYWCRLIKDGDHCIDTKDNFIHCIRTNWYPDGEELYHFKIHILDMLPIEMKKYYESVHNALIFGFIRKIENNNVLWYDIPLELKQLILSYYPTFLYIH